MNFITPHAVGITCLGIRPALLTLVVCFAGSAFAQDAGPRVGLKLVWQDDFDGDSLDYSKWGIEENAFGGGNAELQIYTDRKENVRVDGGNLILEARNDKVGRSGTEREYSSGRVRTKNRGDWKYGYIEVRAKVPEGAGLWPAIWMLPTEEHYGGWAASGEIDIMEFDGAKTDVVIGTLHYGKQWPNNTYTGEEHKLPGGRFCDDFHTFAVRWSEGKIEWYVDDKLVQTQTKWSSSGGEFPAPFNQKFHLILNLAVGGHLVKDPTPETEFPTQFLIDYVRIYQ